MGVAVGAGVDVGIGVTVGVLVGRGVAVGIIPSPSMRGATRKRGREKPANMYFFAALIF